MAPQTRRITLDPAHRSHLLFYFPHLLCSVLPPLQPHWLPLDLGPLHVLFPLGRMLFLLIVPRPVVQALVQMAPFQMCSPFSHTQSHYLVLLSSLSFTLFGISFPDALLFLVLIVCFSQPEWKLLVNHQCNAWC